MALFRLLNYQTADQKKPFQRWLNGLKDRTGRGLIEQRVARMELGNFGDSKFIK